MKRFFPFSPGLRGRRGRRGGGWQPREAPRQGPATSGFLPSHRPAQTRRSLHPPTRPLWVRQDPGQTPSYVFLPCCRKQSVTPPLKPPTTHVPNHNCKEHPLPFPLRSPLLCSSQRVRNAWRRSGRPWVWC